MGPEKDICSIDFHKTFRRTSLYVVTRTDSFITWNSKSGPNQAQIGPNGPKKYIFRYISNLVCQISTKCSRNAFSMKRKGDIEFRHMQIYFWAKFTQNLPENARGQSDCSSFQIWISQEPFGCSQWFFVWYNTIRAIHWWYYFHVGSAQTCPNMPYFAQLFPWEFGTPEWVVSTGNLLNGFLSWYSRFNWFNLLNRKK